MYRHKKKRARQCSKLPHTLKSLILMTKLIKSLDTGKPPENSLLGLSNCSYLTAAFKIRKRQNGEAQAFTTLSESRKIPKKSKKGKRTERVQNGLDPRSKRSIRIISECYVDFLGDKFTFDKHELHREDFPSSCRMVTLTFRNLIPSDKDAKKLLDSFFKRWRRMTGRTIYYIWVAERQKRGAIHFHILTPEYVAAHQIYYEEMQWINRAWNEIVLNYCAKKNLINCTEAAVWSNEIDSSESYFKSLVKFRKGTIKYAPKRPKRSTLLLLPNVTKVYSAGNYMAKYISKENENIIGGMFNASTRSRSFLEAKDVTIKKVISEVSGNKFCDFAYSQGKRRGVYIAMWQTAHNGSKGVWCKDYEFLMQLYYEYIELHGQLDDSLNFEKKVPDIVPQKVAEMVEFL